MTLRFCSLLFVFCFLVPVCGCHGGRSGGRGGGGDEPDAAGPMGDGGGIEDGGTTADGAVHEADSATSSDAGNRADSATSSDAGPTGGRVFVTSSRYAGDLVAATGTSPGTAAADALCQRAAEAAVLGGRWRAWISGPGENAIDRFEGAGPWYLLDGETLLFNNLAHLATTPLHAIDMTEFGERVSGDVWTGTLEGGMAAGADCTGWTVGTRHGTNGGCKGITEQSNRSWTESPLAREGLGFDCDSRNHLYCFEQ